MLEYISKVFFGFRGISDHFWDYIVLINWINECTGLINTNIFCLHSSRAHAPMIAVGSDDSNVTYGGKVQIYEYNEVTRFAFNSHYTFIS